MAGYFIEIYINMVELIKSGMLVAEILIVLGFENKLVNNELFYDFAN